MVINSANDLRQALDQDTLPDGATVSLSGIRFDVDKSGWRFSKVQGGRDLGDTTLYRPPLALVIRKLEAAKEKSVASENYLEAASNIQKIKRVKGLYAAADIVTLPGGQKVAWQKGKWLLIDRVAPTPTPLPELPWVKHPALSQSTGDTTRSAPGEEMQDGDDVQSLAQRLARQHAPRHSGEPAPPREAPAPAVVGGAQPVQQPTQEPISKVAEIALALKLKLSDTTAPVTHVPETAISEAQKALDAVRAAVSSVCETAQQQDTDKLEYLVRGDLCSALASLLSIGFKTQGFISFNRLHELWPASTKKAGNMAGNLGLLSVHTANAAMDADGRFENHHLRFRTLICQALNDRLLPELIQSSPTPPPTSLDRGQLHWRSAPTRRQAL